MLSWLAQKVGGLAGQVGAAQAQQAANNDEMDHGDDNDEEEEDEDEDDDDGEEEDDEEEDEDEDEDEEPAPIREVEIVDAVDERYKFTFAIVPTSEGYAECHWHVEGTVFHQGRLPNSGDTGWTEVGTLKGNLIDREPLHRNGVFHQVCDDESDELRGIACLCCNADGTLRFRNLQGLDAKDMRCGPSNFGSFLHIERVKLAKEHRGFGVGPRMVDRLLAWKGAPWTFAAVSPFTLNDSRDDLIRGRAMLEAPTAEEVARTHELNDKVSRTFARVGFQQCGFGSEYWYLVPHNRPAQVLTKEQVAHVTATRVPTPKRMDPHGVDSALLAVIYGKPLGEDMEEGSNRGMDIDPNTPVTDINSPVTDLIRGVQTALAAGASIDNARLLHRLVATVGTWGGLTEEKTMALLPSLVRLGASVDLADEMGCTALHIAAENTTCSPAMVHTLIALGADRAATSVDGTTPLRAWSDCTRSNRDFVRCFDLGVTAAALGGAMADPQIQFARIDRMMQDHLLRCKRFDDNLEKGLALLTDVEGAAMVERGMTQRMLSRLHITTEGMVDQDEDCMPSFEDGVLLSVDERDVSGWDHIPLSVAGTHVHKGFAFGWMQAIRAVELVLRGGRLPTPQRVLESLLADPTADARYTQSFLDNGGKVEFAIDFVLARVLEQVKDGSFDNIYNRDDEEESIFDGLPEVPELDEDVDLMWGMLLGPGFNRGPFYRPR